MIYSVVLTQRAVKDLDRIDAEMKTRILRKLQDCAEDPLRSAKKLTDPRIGTYRLRVGD